METIFLIVNLLLSMFMQKHSVVVKHNSTISGLSFTKSDTTIKAAWTTTASANSQITCGGKAGLDNTVSISSTSHLAIVTGLTPSTVYSCTVTSGANTSPAQNVTTNAAATRTLVTNVSIVPPVFSGAPGGGDTIYDFVSSDNNTYAICSDCFGFAAGNNAGDNFQIAKITNESTGVGTDINLMTNYGAFNTTNGTDGPGGIALTNKNNGIFSMGGTLYMFPSRNDNSGTTANAFAGGCNVIADNANHGASWNNYLHLTTFNSNGNFIGFGVGELATFNYGWCTPIRYAVDDGTIGYNTSGNGIDGADGFIYIQFLNQNQVGNDMYLARIPRIQFSVNPPTALQYWCGPEPSPTAANFVDDTQWSSSDACKTSILHSAIWNYGWEPITYIPTINSYVMMGTLQKNGSTNFDFYFLAGTTPAGPWSPIFVRGSRLNRFYSMHPWHRDIATNVATNAIPAKMMYTQGSGYHTVLGSATLNTTGMAPVVFDVFGQAADESPLSTGGTGAANWTVIGSTVFPGQLRVALNYLDATSASSTGMAFWNNGSWNANQYSEISLGANAAHSGSGNVPVIGVLLTTTTGYIATVAQGAGACQIQKITGGTTATTLGAAYTCGSGTGVQDDVWRLTSSACTVSSCTLTVTLCPAASGGAACSTIATRTDSSTPLTSGKPGAGCFESNTINNGCIEFWSAGQ